MVFSVSMKILLKKNSIFIGATGVAEYSMIARDVMIAYDTQAHVHIQHLSKAESVKVVEFASKTWSSSYCRSGTAAFL